MSRKKANRLLAAFMLASVAGCNTQEVAPEPVQTPEDAAIKDVLGIIAENAYTHAVPDIEAIKARVKKPEAPMREQITETLKGILKAVDPHSNYLTEKEYKDMRERNRGFFAGIGVDFTFKDDQIQIASVRDATPAFTAGVKNGDIITAINGRPASEFKNQDEIVAAIRGDVGTKVTLDVFRPNTPPLSIPVTRAIIQFSSVMARLLNNNVGYIKINDFGNGNVARDTSKYLVEFQNDRPALKGFILDLRDDPGGLLDQAVAVADMFLTDGDIVTVLDRHPEDNQIFRAQPADLINGLPLIVMMNDGSASASEIVAGALQDHRRAIVMGIQSYGKGSVQNFIPLPPDSAIGGAARVTTALYFTPHMHSIQGLGITPDVLVDQPQARTDHENTLSDAIANPDAPTVERHKAISSCALKQPAARTVSKNFLRASDQQPDVTLLCAYETLTHHNPYTITLSINP